MHQKSRSTMSKIEQDLYCCVPTCRFHVDANQEDLAPQNLFFYPFPDDQFLNGMWSEKCSASSTNESSVCSLHFTEDDYETEIEHSEFLNFAPKRVLKKNAIPSINLPSSLLCGTVVILNQQLPINATAVSVVSHSDWLEKSEAEVNSVKLNVSSDLISRTKSRELWELCRMCAGFSESMVPIFNEDGSDKDIIAFKLKQLFAIDVNTSDVLPIRLCCQCLIDLNFCHQLSLKCAQADAALRCLLEAEATINSNQETGSDWQLHEESPADHTEKSKHSWEDQALDTENWSHVEEESDMPPKVETSEIVQNEQKLIVQNHSEEKSKQAVKVCLRPVLQSKEKTVRRASFRLKRDRSLKDESRPEASELTGDENLENVPLRDRLRNKTRQTVISCRECGKKFENRLDVKLHLQNSHDKFECKVCEELFDSKEEAEKHESTPHNILCAECKQVFPTQSSLQTHTTLEHANKKPFICYECGNHFISKATLRVHLRSHTGKRSTICDICGKAFRTCDALRQHKFVHMTDEEKKSMGFPCTLCDKNFSRRTKLEYHMRRHTNERHFTCTICNKSFHDSVRLKAHTERHSTDKKFKCDECGSGFVCKRYLTNHKSRYHRRREVIRCSVCLVVLPSAEEAVVHHRTHTSEEIAQSGVTNPYTQSFDHHCRQCCEYFPGKEQLDAHKAKAHVRGRSTKATAPVDIAELIKQVDCTVCGKKLWGMGSLKRHMSSHAGSRPERTFQCEFCAKMFAQKAQLVVHIRTHTGERPHRCSFCGKGFITGQSLIKHERIHTGETPFHCTQCPKAFRSKENLILHQKTHLGLKPFECHYCHKSFGRQIHLQLHLRTHTGERPYVCDICGRAFAQGGDMRRHKLTHTGERAYKCTVCSFSSNKRKTLRDHEASVHSKPPPDPLEVALPVAPRPGQATLSVPVPQQYTATIIQDSRTVMYFTASDMHKNWGEN